MTADSALWPPNDVRQVLSAAGWREDWDVSRRVEEWERALAPCFSAFPAAREALRCFGGLRVVQNAPGEECARETFEFDPMRADLENDRFDDFSEVLQTRLYPLGEVADGHLFLAISEDGRVFILMDTLWLVGETIEDAIVGLVRGRLPGKIET